MAATAEYYAAVRKSPEGDEIIPSQSIYPTEKMVQRAVDELHEHVPDWSTSWPLQRIVKVHITELVE